MPDVDVRQASGSEIIDISDGQMLTSAQLDAAQDAQLDAAIATLHEEMATAA
jgi:hypothetical protein